MKIEELTIPVPWGTVAAKAWGSNEDPHILVFHGIQDNAGSFDRLIPLLPKTYYYICVDLPGHGRSSHFQPHLLIHSVDFTLVYKLIVDYFGKHKYIILGHSFGSLIGSLFCRIYPEHVEKLIMLDTIHLYPYPSSLYIHTLREKFDGLLGLYLKSRPSYTYEEAVKKIQLQRPSGELTEEAAKCLFERMNIPTQDGKYYFTVDPRLRFFTNPLHDFRYAVEYLKKNPFQCPVLLIITTSSDMQRQYMKPVIKLFEKEALVYIKYIPGYHDVHMNEPEAVSKYITRFIANKSKL